MPNPGAKRNVFLRPALHDRVADADIDDVGQVIAGSRLGSGKADGACETADDGDNAIRLHLLDFLGACLRVRASVAEHHLELGAAEPFEAAGIVDLLDGHFSAHAAKLAVLRKRSGDGLQDADLYGLRLGAQIGRHGEHGRGCGACPQNRTAGWTHDILHVDVLL